MAELTTEQRNVLLRAFLQEYNIKRSTNFSLDHLCDNAIDASCDYHLIDPNDGELKIQLTTPPGESGYRKVYNQERKFPSGLKTVLTESGLRGIGVLLSYLSLPQKKNEQKNLISELALVISSLSSSLKSLSYTILSRQDLCGHAKSLGRHFVSLEIIGLPNKDATPMVLMVSNCSRVPDPAVQVEESYFKKLNRYGNSAHDLILLIYFAMNPYDADEINSMISALSPFSCQFREVWTLCNVHSDTPKIDCIKP
jgi:hypothetical protein